MWKEFKEFAVRGNMIDLAVGIIIGTAFGKIVTSFVNDILMPPLGLLMGRLNLSDHFIVLSGGQYPTLAQAREAGAVTLNYGLFISTIVDFILVAFAIFLLVRWINRLKAQPAPAPAALPTTKDCPYCFTAIPIQATRCPNCTSELK